MFSVLMNRGYIIMAIIGLIGSLPIGIVIVIFIMFCIFAELGDEEAQKQVEEASNIILTVAIIVLLVIGFFVYIVLRYA